jgi:hypothetical protein
MRLLMQPRPVPSAPAQGRPAGEGARLRSHLAPITAALAGLAMVVVPALFAPSAPAGAAVVPPAAAAPAQAMSAYSPPRVEFPAGVTLPRQAARPASVTVPRQAAVPGGACQVPGIGDIGGLLGFCAAGSSGLIGDLNSICQPSVPAPEPAAGGIDALIRPPATAGRVPVTLYDRYGMAGQSWAAYGLQCSDMASLIGNNVAGVVFDAAKALDRVTITVYQSAAGEGILSWLTAAVDRLVVALGNAIYFPYLAPVVIFGAIWLAWQGLIRKRATRTIEGTVWMVVACAAAIWLIGRPADFTGLGQGVSDGITSALNVAFAKLPAPAQSSCVPLASGDPQVPRAASFGYAPGNGVVDANANELWTVLVCKPWLDGEFGTTAYAGPGKGHPTVVNRYGRALLWAQAIAVNEKPTASLITAKEDAYAGIAESVKNSYPAVYPLFQGKQWATRLEIGFAALFAALAAGALVLLIAITLIVLKLGFLLLLVVGPFFLVIGTHPGFGRVIALRWAELLIGVLLKQAAVALVLSVLLYAYSLIMGASDAVLPWALKILMISLVTVAVFIYRKPFAHLFSAVGYGVIGSAGQAETALARAGGTAARNTRDAATLAIPGFAAYQAARWARRNPARAAGLAAQVASAGAAAGLAGAAQAGGAAGDRAAAAGSGAAAGGGGSGAAGTDGQPAPAGPSVRLAARDRARPGPAGPGRARQAAPPLDLPPRPGAPPPGPSPAPSAFRPAREGRQAAPRPLPPRDSPPPAGTPQRPGPGGPPPAWARHHVRPARPVPPATAPVRGTAATSSPVVPGQDGGQAAGDGRPAPFWLRPLRRRR